MPQKLDYLKETPSQTAGPYVHIGLVPKQAGFDIYENNFGNVVPGEGERIRLRGIVRDGTGAPITDVLVETWQADAQGSFSNPGFRGWARAGSAFDTGEWMIETIRPGAAPNRDGTTLAPQILFWIVARGINVGLNTRMYFPEAAEANAADPVFRKVLPHRKATLVAVAGDMVDGVQEYRFDIRVQGGNETVFFDV
jgi:protocatechuate 3,4-dioxygenase, alpha subunit